MKKENDTLKDELVKMKERLDSVDKKSCENSGDKILEEIAERSSKDRNLVLHNCLESNASNPEEAQRDDLVGVQTLFNELGLREVVAKEVLLGWRRLGQRKTNILVHYFCTLRPRVIETNFLTELRDCHVTTRKSLEIYQLYLI